MAAALLLLLALAQAAPGAVAMPQLSEARQPGAASVAGDGAPSGARERERLAQPPQQVETGRRSAEAAPALSNSAQGRALATAPVGGRDRCDAASAAASPLCRDRVEARAGEFSAPTATPVTAEGRLLLLTQPQGNAQAMTATGASRRLGGTAADVERAAGSVAGELAAAISQTQGGASAQVTPAGGSPASPPTAGLLPAGVPSVVVTTPR